MLNRACVLLLLMCLGACASANIGATSKGGWHHSGHTDWSWKWSFPVPHGNQLTAVWVAPNDDAWAAGSAGTIVHVSSKGEEVLPTPTQKALQGIWGSQSDDIWAVGRQGTILHWDGRVWAPIRSPVEDDLRAIWGSDRDSVWAVGATRIVDARQTRGGTILHWDGQQWSVVAREVDQRFAAVWGTSRTDVYVGGRGSIWHFDGSHWSTFSLFNLDVAGIWGTSGQDVWAVGSDHIMAHWNGKDWSLHSVQTQVLTSIGGTGRDNVWATGVNGLWHISNPDWSGSQFDEGHDLSAMPRWMGWQDQGATDAMQIKAAAGRPGGSLWLVGSNGSLMVQRRHKGLETIRPLDFTLTRQPLADDQGGVWLLDGDAKHARRRERDWRPDDSILDGLAGRDKFAHFRFHVSDVNQLWACGSNGCSVRTGGLWNNSILSGAVEGVASASASQVWALRGHELLIWQGGHEWKAHAVAGPEPWRTAGTALSDIWLLAAESVFHFDGTEARPQALPGHVQPINVCVNARDDAWIVAVNGLLHWDGQRWLLVESPVKEHLASLWCGGRDDVWAGGDGGVIISWDGRSWRQTHTPTTTPIYEITGGSTGVWATGWGGVVLHYGP